VVAILSLSAWMLADLMSAKLRESDDLVRSAQARALADSGIHYAMAVLADPSAYTDLIGSNPFYNDAMSPQEESLLGLKGRGRFRLIAPLGPDDPARDNRPYKFGVIDESSKLNLNTLMTLTNAQYPNPGDLCKAVLAQLPPLQQNADLAESIVCWLASSGSRSGQDSDNEYYGTLQQPYQCKCAPLDSIDELLLVKGMTPAILYGDDLNHSGVPSSTQGASGTFNKGLAQYLTVYSSEANFDADGNPRINVNRTLSSQDDVTTLITDITNAFSGTGTDATGLANFIVAARLGNGVQPTGGGGGAPQVKGGGDIPQSALTYKGAANGKVNSLYDLLNGVVTIQATQQQGNLTIQIQMSYPSPLNDATAMQNLAPTLFDKLTTTSSSYIPARVNVMTAPLEVLQAIPGMTPDDKSPGTDLPQAIITARQNVLGEGPLQPNLLYQTPAWILTQTSAPIKADQLKAFEPFITSTTNVYRVQSIGDFEEGGPFARVEAVIEVFAHRARIKYYRDLQEFGKGVDD
jgi:hypothetical protein